VPDISEQLRPITADEWPRFVRAMDRTFGEVTRGPYTDQPSPTAELDRSLALVDEGQVVATAGIYSLRLSVPGAVVPTAGITWITVAPTHRRRGVLRAIMQRQLTEVHEAQREPVAALWAAEAGIYGRFGYAPATSNGGWSGDPTRLRLRGDVDTGTGTVRLVEESDYREAAVPLYDRVRRLVPGNLERDDRWWARRLRDEPEDRDGATARQYVLHRETDGTATGYAAYRIKASWTDRNEPAGVLTVDEVRSTTPSAHAALWQYLLSHDLVRTLRAPTLSTDEALRHLLVDTRPLYARPTDALWVRLVDVDRALSARRYPAPIDLVIEVRDPTCAWNDGRWRLSGHPAGAWCGRTDRDPDLVIGIEALSAAYLGGVSLGSLQAAGRVTEVSPGAVTLASTAFSWPVPPWCPDMF
jgi:predicted acetyltransferase